MVWTTYQHHNRHGKLKWFGLSRVHNEAGYVPGVIHLRQRGTNADARFTTEAAAKEYAKTLDDYVTHVDNLWPES